MFSWEIMYHGIHVVVLSHWPPTQSAVDPPNYVTFECTRSELRACYCSKVGEFNSCSYTSFKFFFFIFFFSEPLLANLLSLSWFVWFWLIFFFFVIVLNLLEVCPGFVIYLVPVKLWVTVKLLVLVFLYSLLLLSL